MDDIFSLRVVEGLPPVSIAGSDAVPGAGGVKAARVFSLMSAAAWKDTRWVKYDRRDRKALTPAGIKPGPHSPSFIPGVAA